MKRILAFTIILITLTSCASPQTQTNMQNPASVYCEQTGNKLEIVTAADGSQSGKCVFPDGSVCDEWTYYRGECGPATQKSPTPTMAADATTVGNTPGNSMPPGEVEKVVDWWGVIKSTEPGSQYDDYFERQDLGQAIYFGVDSMDPAVQSEIESLRNSGQIVHLYGALISNVPDYNGSQILVDQINVE